MTTAPELLDVLEGRSQWTCERGDCVEWLKALPDDSVDLLFTSPPYELARTYGIGEKMVGGQAWVDWMVEVVTAASPKVKGLIAVNCEGQTRNYSYSGAPFLLFADLKRAGLNMRKPPVFHRVGIPGSGGPDWLRNDYEPVICVTREGRLPWSDNTACGHAPKYAPGGEMSNRLRNGQRVTQWGGRVRKDGGLTSTDCNRDGSQTQTRLKPSHRILEVGAIPPGKLGRTKQSPGREGEEEIYTPPAIANPGNVIACTVGGGHLGHDIAHENEAPFPLELPTFFVLSFCPPNGVVCDPFSGSGTTAHAALNHGRRFVGCDVRQSQVDLTRRRLRSVTPTLFSEDG